MPPNVQLPHPIPYQGSKRRLSRQILALVEGLSFRRFFEPFGGSAAISIAAAESDLARDYVIGDSFEALTQIWSSILDNPASLAAEYESIWTAQLADPSEHFKTVRKEFNTSGGAARLLYLLARCVKNSPRFNAAGEFNQSPDNRRRGMRPAKMVRQIWGAHQLLSGVTHIRSGDFVDQLTDATPQDLVYLDPPWEGTTVGTNKRYHSGLPRTRLIEALEDLDARRVPYLLSYDGRHGEKTYGEVLPESIGASRLELDAGRSTQATLNGRSIQTIESLYVSRHIALSKTSPTRLRLVAG